MENTIKKTMRSFETWSEEQVQKELLLKKINSLNSLTQWIDAEKVKLTTVEEFILNRLSASLKRNTNVWNEDELKMNFIGPLLVEVNYDEELYKNFSQRKLSATINNILVGGVVDYVIASGYQKPNHPFFCLHEYKRPRRTGGYNDPVGQLLSEMVTVQVINKQNNIEHPIYGIYVEGKFWNFVVLEGNTYAESESYNANTDQIFDIFDILKNLKTIISTLISKYNIK